MGRPGSRAIASGGEPGDSGEKLRKEHRGLHTGTCYPEYIPKLARVKIPALVGINPGAGYLTELHTHDDSGVIHIEAQKSRDFTVGQFFSEWAVHLDANSIGGYKGLKWYLDGKRQTGNPQTLILKPHQEIAFVVGKPPAKIPSSYAFPAGE